MTRESPRSLLKKFGGKVKPKDYDLRVFFAADIHGSEPCWRKFINAGPFYEADVLILGGDIAGKAAVPVVRDDRGWTATVRGETRLATTEQEFRDLVSAIRMNGLYPIHLDPDELRDLRASPTGLQEAINSAIDESLRGWLQLADERLGTGPIQAFIMPGNDDPMSIEPVLEEGRVARNADDRIVMVGNHEMISLGYSNRTPWNTDRELDEEEIYNRLNRLAEQLESPSSAILNVHVPPYDSGLDTAFQLDENFRPVMKGGTPKEIPVGSTAVTQIIEELQPLLALHGHIHEARGVTRIGRTTVINPGSDYNSGRLLGVVIDLDGTSVVREQLVQG